MESNIIDLSKHFIEFKTNLFGWRHMDRAFYYFRYKNKIYKMNICG